MSTINASDRARATEEIREAREEYEAREANNVKKQRKELKRANEKHVAEISKLQEQYQTQVDELRDRQKENMSVKDQRFQKEIERVKSLYVDQMKRKSMDNEEQRNIVRETHSQELNQERRAAATQREVLTENFHNSIKERDKDMQQYAEDSTIRMKGAITNRGEKLKERFDRDMKAIIEDRDRSAEQQARDIKNLRTNFKNRVDDLDRKNRSDRLKDQSNFKSALENTQSTNNEVLTTQRELLAAERKSIQKRFGDTLEKRLEEMGEAERNLKETAMDRIDRQVRKAETGRREAEQGRILDSITAKRMQGTTERHLNEQFENRLSEVEKQKRLQRDIILDIADQRVDDQLHKNEKILQETNRRHKMDSNIRTQQARDEFANLETVTRGQVLHSNSQAEERVRKIVDTTTKAQQNQQKFHEKNLDVMKNTYVDNLANQRQAQMEQLQKIRVTMENRLRDNMNRSEQQLDKVTGQYEAEIAQLKERHKEEIERTKASIEQRLSQRDKSADVQREAQELKFKSKLSAMEETHQADLDRLQRRHQEQIASMEARIKSINRKV